MISVDGNDSGNRTGAVSNTAVLARSSSSASHTHLPQCFGVSVSCSNSSVVELSSSRHFLSLRAVAVLEVSSSRHFLSLRAAAVLEVSSCRHFLSLRAVAVLEVSSSRHFLSLRAVTRPSGISHNSDCNARWLTLLLSQRQSLLPLDSLQRSPPPPWSVSLKRSRGTAAAATAIAASAAVRITEALTWDRDINGII